MPSIGHFTSSAQFSLSNGRFFYHYQNIFDFCSIRGIFIKNDPHIKFKTFALKIASLNQILEVSIS